VVEVVGERLAEHVAPEHLVLAVADPDRGAQSAAGVADLRRLSCENRDHFTRPTKSAGLAGVPELR
jgi:hypothetical protein